MDNKPNFPREVKLQWAGSRERNLASGRGGTFFLTSLFIERFDRWSMSDMAMLRQQPSGDEYSRFPREASDKTLRNGTAASQESGFLLFGAAATD
jgi:hypothetical protein